MRSTLHSITNRHRFLALAAALTLPALAFVAWPQMAHAAGVDSETQFVLNTFAFLIWGALVMWMCAGFTMLEAGSVRTKNAAMICLKNIGLYSIAGLAFYFIGYNLMYNNVQQVIGTVVWPLYGPSGDEMALLAGDDSALAAVVDNGYSVMSDWFFQMVFVATTASIVSGALAERVKMWSFFIFTLLLTAFIYPIIGSWTWGGGWLTCRDGFPGLRGIDNRAQHRRLGGPGRRIGGWAPAGEIPAGRISQGHAAVKRGAGDAGRVHPVVRVVRVQRGLATGVGFGV